MLIIIIFVQIFTIILLIILIDKQNTTNNKVINRTEQLIIQETLVLPHITELSIEIEPFEKNPVIRNYYNTLSSEEIFLLEVTIQHEVGNFSKKYKTYVAELIYNRIKSDDFPNTIRGVLFQEGQFQGIQHWAYSGIEIDNETKEVIYEVFSKEHTSHPATFYYNPELSEYESIIWFEYSGDIEFVFEHCETLWGIDYNTRFFK